tara:strand:- start:245 stop:502 length:258 start_codon:yes stop_codon:yes gene_type:complete
MKKIANQMHNHKYEKAVEFMRDSFKESTLKNEELKLKSIEVKLAFEKGFDSALVAISQMLSNIKTLDDLAKDYYEDGQEENTEES